MSERADPFSAGHRPWESAGTFNPAVVLHNGKFVSALPRPGRFRHLASLVTPKAPMASISRGALNRCSPRNRLRKRWWCRRSAACRKFGDTYYLTYTGYNKKMRSFASPLPRDLIHWKRERRAPSRVQGNWNVAWTKSGAIVPEKIDGKYWMYWLGTTADKTDQMGLSYSTDLIHWTEATATPVFPRRAGMFDSRVVEPGPPPISHVARHRPHLQRRRRQTRLSHAPLPSSTAMTPASCSSALMLLSSPRKRNGRKSARSLTSSSSKAWFARGNRFPFYYGEPTSMWSGRSPGDWRERTVGSSSKT